MISDVHNKHQTSASEQSETEKVSWRKVDTKYPTRPLPHLMSQQTGGGQYSYSQNGGRASQIPSPHPQALCAIITTFKHYCVSPSH